MNKLFFILLFNPLLVLAQSKSGQEKNPVNLESIEYKLDDKAIAQEEIKLPFKEIKVIDARFDTSKLGFQFQRKLIDLNYKDFKKIKLIGGVSNSIQNFYNSYYQSCFKDSARKLVLVLKTLWIDNLPNNSIGSSRNDIQKKSFQDIYTKIEYYANIEESYYPLKRIDTVYQLTEENIASLSVRITKTGIGFLIPVLKSLIEKYNFPSLISDLHSKRKLNIQQIDSFNNRRFSIPILTDNNIKKGVFMNFKEFINNDPSVINYKKTRNGIQINEDSIHSHQYWAYADDNALQLAYLTPDNKSNMYPILGNFVKGRDLQTTIDLSNIRKLDFIRSGNTFEFFIYNYIYLPKTTTGNILNLIPINGGGGSAVKTKLILSPKQIDMETGNIY